MRFCCLAHLPRLKCEPPRSLLFRACRYSLCSFSLLFFGLMSYGRDALISRAVTQFGRYEVGGAPFSIGEFLVARPHLRATVDEAMHLYSPKRFFLLY